ncbi:hypothetical protein ACOMHN_020891 [Nucella lapillus]
MWDYLGKIRQAGSRDICLLRFIPGSEDEKSGYVHLYSYLSGRSRCGVVGNPPKYVKDLYIVPLASHSKILQVLLPFEGPCLEGNRPHMLIGIVVRQKLKRPRESSESSTHGKSPHSHPDKTSALSSAAKKSKPTKKEETEAYSPTAEGDDGASDAAPYIPTPTHLETTSDATSDVSVSVSSTTKDSVSVTSAATLSASAAVNIISSILPNLQTPGPAVSKTATTPGVSSSDIISSILPSLQASTASMTASKIILSNLQTAAASAAASKTTTSVRSSLFSPPSASSSKVSVGPEVRSVGDGKSSESTTSRVSSNTPSIDNMPLALKALMEDLKGNTQMVKAVDKRTEPDRREREKKEAKEASAKEASETEKKDSTKEMQAKDSNSVIPGHGEVKESDSNIPGFDTTHRLSPLAPKADLLQGDVDLCIQGETEARLLSSVHDQDNRFTSHLHPGPDSMPPPPPHDLGFPPPPPSSSSFMLPAHQPPVLPPPHLAMEVPDIDY